jgi:hypothetical protein
VQPLKLLRAGGMGEEGGCTAATYLRVHGDAGSISAVTLNLPRLRGGGRDAGDGRVVHCRAPS